MGWDLRDLHPVDSRRPIVFRKLPAVLRPLRQVLGSIPVLDKDLARLMNVGRRGRPFAAAELRTIPIKLRPRV
jgi:hypothetical protein